MAHFEILVRIKRDYYTSACYQAPQVPPLPTFLTFSLSSFLIYVVIPVLLLPPTVQCMLKSSLGARCLVAACAFLISSDTWRKDLAAPFNAEAPMSVPLDVTSEQLCIPGAPLVLLHERLLLYPQGQLGHLTSPIACYGIPNHPLL